MRMDPGRAALCAATAARPGGARPSGSSRNCTLCGSSSHTTWTCSICARCGDNHKATDCQQDVDNLWCSYCSCTGHATVVCLKQRRGRPPPLKGTHQQTGNSHYKGSRHTPAAAPTSRARAGGQDLQCWGWARDGQCKWGSNCRFQHSSPGRKRPRGGQHQRRRPAPPQPVPQQPVPQQPVPPTASAHVTSGAGTLPVYQVYQPAAPHAPPQPVPQFQQPFPSPQLTQQLQQQVQMQVRQQVQQQLGQLSQSQLLQTADPTPPPIPARTAATPPQPGASPTTTNDLWQRLHALEQASKTNGDEFRQLKEMYGG